MRLMAFLSSPGANKIEYGRTVLHVLPPFDLKDKSGVDEIIVKKQPYQLLNTSREFFPSFHASNFHKLDD